MDNDKNPKKAEGLKKKKEYVPPQIKLNFIKIEEGIATASAMIMPTDINNQMDGEWEKGTDVSEGLSW